MMMTMMIMIYCSGIPCGIYRDDDDDNDDDNDNDDNNDHDLLFWHTMRHI